MYDNLSKSADGALRLRPIRAEDETFLRAVYASTRDEEMQLTPWNEAQREAFITMQFTAQHQHYHSRFPDAAYETIEWSGEPAGRRYVLREPDQMRILDLTLLPEYRNAGIGTQLIEALMAEAAGSRRPLRIYVETFNRSQRLFARLGFVPVENDGVNALLEWRS
jgi:GNAT superfamily N-acetyltransferase